MFSFPGWSDLLPPGVSSPAVKHSGFFIGNTSNRSLQLSMEVIVVITIIGLVIMSANYLFLRIYLRFAGVGQNRIIAIVESNTYNLSTLKTATNNFSDSNIIRHGGFGPVYKGVLLDGIVRAVKRLSQICKQGLKELQTEATMAAKLLHENVIKVLGYCLKEKENLLVYEYLPNGSLDVLLFGVGQNRIIAIVESNTYNLSTLKTATNNFSDSNIIGHGGFGPVYKGVLLDGQVIAVKRLSQISKQGLKELQTEAMRMS